MLGKTLYILVEGNDDIRFFEYVVKPLIQEKFSSIKIVPYQGRGPKKTNEFIRVINVMGAEYILVRDLNGAPCIPSKKAEIKSKCKIIEEKKILIVDKKIEGWYLGGLNEITLKDLRIRKKINTTDKTDKEEFNHLIPKNLSSLQFKLKILRNYDVETAKTKNSSFRYFFNKWINDVSSV